MRTAIINAYYGEDFAQEAVLSIANQVDYTLFLWADKPWGSITEGAFEVEGSTKIPSPVDNTLFKVMQLAHPKVHFMKNAGKELEIEVFNITSQLLSVIPKQTRWLIFTNGIDVIQIPGNINVAIQEMEENNFISARMKQRWLWKTLEYEALLTSAPNGSLIWDLPKILKNNQEELLGENAMRQAPFLKASCWNVGLVWKPRTQRWRCSIRAAQLKAKVGDLEHYFFPTELPITQWLDKWEAWDKITGEEKDWNLDISSITPVTEEELPPELRRRL